jgi:glucose dehydrogenase
MIGAKSYDVCIVGSGIAGALIAAEATRNGRSVIMIEAGQRFEFADRLHQLRDYEILHGPLWPYSNAQRDVYVDTSEESLGVPYMLERYRVKGVGGSTLHWGARINRLMPSDFRTAATYGLGIDWPLSYADLEPYYSQADWEIGVAGAVHLLHPPRSRDYPMTAFPLSVDEAVWLPVAERLRIPVYSTAFAINSRPYNGRSQCLAFAACNVCPSGARYSADFHVKEAEASGRCDLLTNTVARRIERGANGAVTAIHASTLDGKDREIRGKVYVIAAHAIESARLLLLSNCGNHSDQVGRNFMEHIYVGGGGYLPHKRFYPNRIGFERLESLHYYDGKERRDRGAIKLEFVYENDPLARMEGKRVWGKAMGRYDRENFGHWIGIEAETEVQYNPNSRVTLDATVKDLFGDPAPNIRFAISDVDRRTQSRALGIIEELLHASGVKDVEPDVLSENSFAAHQMGTCRMSDDPNRGVVDRNCRVHGASNLYMAGSSVFPTVGALQPTLTIAALSLRLARHLFGSEH